MIEKIKDFFIKITKPGWTSTAVAALVLIFVAISTTLLLTLDFTGTLWEPIAYICFALSAIGLAYAVCVIVVGAPTFKKRVSELLDRREFTKKLVQNWGYRTIVSSSLSFLATLVNSVINAYLGIITRSIWFGALATYYIFLALMRSGLLLYHRKKKNFDSEALIRAKKYTRCGILLLILNATLSSAIAQMIFDDRAFEYKDWLIYAFAAYAFYKITMSIINFIRAQRQDDLTIQAIRQINIVDAAVSILALQTALLHTFNDGSVDISLFNTMTGCFVSAFALSMSVFMIVRGNKSIKELKIKDE